MKKLLRSNCRSFL